MTTFAASTPVGSLPAPPRLGCAVPDTEHAVSVQLPKWQDMCDFAQGNPRVKSVLQTGYPRSFIHIHIKKVSLIVVKTFGTEGQACLMFPSQRAAKACGQFLQDKGGRQHAEGFQIKAVVFTCPRSHGDPGTPLYSWAIFFSAESMPDALTFWRLTGLGISSRYAAHALATCQAWKAELQLPTNEALLTRPRPVISEAHNQVCQRIASLVERSPINPRRRERVLTSDVYLYQTGMSAIYELHHMLLKWRNLSTVVFGFPYELTLKMMQTYGPQCKFFGFGTPAELEQLEMFLEAEAQDGRRVQAVWCECASNPLLRTVDLAKIRSLADKYEFLVIVDDTIGSFANIDILDIADVIMSSLTKSFSGYCDVMGGSLVLNPNTPFYHDLKRLFDATYSNDLFHEDARRLEINSRDYLSRSSRINSTASYLVDYLNTQSTDATSSLRAVYYPKTCWSRSNYEALMRPRTPEYAPGYGGLFTLEFRSIQAAQAFFDALDIHKGPSLGANVSLAQPYVQTVFTQEKEWAERYGLHASIVRIAVGLEDPHALLDTFRASLATADQIELRGGFVEDEQKLESRL